MSLMSATSSCSRRSRTRAWPSSRRSSDCTSPAARAIPSTSAAWGDYEWHTLKLTAHTTSGLGHLGLRVRDEATLQRFVARLEARGVQGQWIEDVAHGPAYRCATPDGHAVELYWETRRFTATPEVATAFKNQPQRYVPRGIAPRRLDHVNILARDVSCHPPLLPRAARAFG